MSYSFLGDYLPPLIDRILVINIEWGDEQVFYLEDFLMGQRETKTMVNVVVEACFEELVMQQTAFVVSKTETFGCVKMFHS